MSFFKYRNLMHPQDDLLVCFTELRQSITLQFTPMLTELNISVLQCQILLRLSQSGCSIAELTSITMNDKAAVSRSVMTMEKSNLVKREPSRIDKRKITVTLTAKGKTAAVKALKIRQKVTKEINRHLSQDEQEVFNTLAKKLSLGLSHT